MLTLLFHFNDLAAATLRVGPGEAFATPSAAAAVARDGDVVDVAPGAYFDCAVWRASRLIVEGTAPGVVLTDTACDGKAAFVIRGDAVTLRDLTFTRIRVPDGNGAGIRAEGGALTIERSRFINNQAGILAADGAGSSLVIRDCEFRDNGASGRGTADIRAGRISLLSVQGSRLHDVGGGASIDSAASDTTLSANLIEASGDTLAIVMIAHGGSALMRDNRIVLSGTAPRLGAIVVTEDGATSPTTVTLQGTALINRTGSPVVLLRNWSSATPRLAGNSLAAGDTEVSDHGATLHRVKQVAHGVVALLWKIASHMRGQL